MSTPRHFLDLGDVESGVLRSILDASAAMKHRSGGKQSTGNGSAEGHGTMLGGKTLAMIFEKPSTRTRVSFEVAMRQLGGHVIVLEPEAMQLGRGETIADTARVLSRYVDAIMLRTSDHGKLEEMARHATVPVINGLSDRSHPCQIMADVMTFEEWKGPIRDRTVAWVGDGNNVLTSWIQAAARLGFRMRIGTPERLRPPRAVLDWAEDHGARIELTEDPREAVSQADAVVTDVWVSMNSTARNRHNVLARYRVDAELMEAAGNGAIFMHCLPAHRGEEVTDEVIDGPRSAVWDEAENRLHAQKGILAWCLA